MSKKSIRLLEKMRCNRTWPAPNGRVSRVATRGRVLHEAHKMIPIGHMITCTSPTRTMILLMAIDVGHHIPKSMPTHNLATRRHVFQLPLLLMLGTVCMLLYISLAVATDPASLTLPQTSRTQPKCLGPREGSTTQAVDQGQACQRHDKHLRRRK